MSARTSRVDWLIFFALGICWGTSYLFIKIGVETLTPFTLIAGRLAIGAALLAIALRVSGERLPRERRVYGHFVVMAILNIVIPFSLITWGEQSIDSALAAVLNSSVPLFTIVVAALVLPDEPITINRIVGLVVGFAGVVLLTSRNVGPTGTDAAGVAGGPGQFVGEIALIGSAVAYAVGNVYARRFVRGQRPMINAFFQVFLAFCIMSTLAVTLEHPFSIALRPDAVFAVAWLGILGSGFAYLFFFRLLASWGSTRSSMVAYLLPVVGIVAGFLVLRETVDARVLGGTVLIIGGVAVVNSRFGSRRLFGRSQATTRSSPAHDKPTRPLTSSSSERPIHGGAAQDG
jgi:drug/metabolite transporter (DMT)-like permease